MTLVLMLCRCIYANVAIVLKLLDHTSTGDAIVGLVPEPATTRGLQSWRCINATSSSNRYCTSTSEN